MELKDIVKGNYVRFRKYRKGILTYAVIIVNNTKEDEGGIYEFPVPIEDCGDADFLAHDKAILFMRYIRKALEEGTFVKC